MGLAGVSPKLDRLRGGELSVHQDLASVGTSTQSRPFVLWSPTVPHLLPSGPLRRPPSLGSISLIVQSLQARLGWFGRPLVYTIRKILFAPPDHCVRNLSDRKPRWKLRWTLRCWPGIAVHYVIRRVHRCTIPTPYFRGHYRDMTERITWCTINFEIRRPCWISGKLRRGSFTLGTVLRPLRPCPSPAEPGTPLEPLTPLSTMDAMIYDVDPPQLAALEHLEDEKDDLRDALKDCRRDNAGLKRTGAHHEEVISILQQGIKSREEETDYCFKKREEERENNARLLKDREELLLLWLRERESLMDYISGTIRNTGHRVTRLLSSITTHDLSTIVNFLRAQEEAIKQRDGDSEPGLATCCASIMAEPAMLTLCASVLAGVQAEKEYLVRFNKALHYQIRSLRRTLFAFRKRAWTVAIVRRVGDMVAGPEPPPLTDFFSIEKGDDTHLVCESAADIPASSSTNFKSYVVDDVFIARSNAIIGEVLTPLFRRADGKHDVCCIADGQSGSGKSYTLFNGPNALAPRIGKDILTRESPYEYRVTCTALEVCQDGLKDLLDAEGSPTTGPPESRSPRGKKPRALENHVSKSITSEAQLCSLLAEACQRRRVSATGANAVSSRGHMICTLTIESASLASPESTRVVIVDLAGSERRQNESLTDDEKAETKFINNSRTEIRRALISLANNEIPAKDSMVRGISIDQGRLPANPFS